MRYFLTLVAALLVTVTLAVPAQAQQRVVKPQTRAVQQPRAFTKKFKDRTKRGMRTRTRASHVRPRGTSPRFYAKNGAARTSYRIRRRLQTRARANLSPARQSSPRFYSSGSATAISNRIRRHTTRQVKYSRQAKPTRTRPTFWK